MCLAVRSGQEQKAQEGFNKILTTLEGEQLLMAIGDCLLAAYRHKQPALADSLLRQARAQLLELVAKKELAACTSSFLQRLAFSACDRQALAAQSLLAELVLRFSRSQAQEQLLADFWQEWLSLAARMARRNWGRETRLLLRLFLHCLLQEKPERMQAGLLMLQLHFVVYARWDGFSHACSAYVELVYFYLLLLRRAAKAGTEREQQVYLLLTLRSMRDIVAHVSRSLMQDDMDIFRLWYQFFWQLAGDNVKRKHELQLLLQLSIRYWQSTRPKTSRKQVSFLEDLLQPSLITEHYAVLLQKIS